jgi:putative transcriptional regulator
MSDQKENTGYLEGQLLLAMPAMGDPRFERTVIFVCAHSEDGAMGLVINRPTDQISFPDLLTQLAIEVEQPRTDVLVHAGGPVEVTRGFVLHTADYVQDSSLVVSDSMVLTATVDILKAIAQNKGPRHSLLALGYAGWGPGQLDAEIQANGWLSLKADEDLVFEAPPAAKWDMAMGRLGVDVSLLSSDIGHA